MLSLTLSLEESRAEVSLPRALPGRLGDVLGMFFQMLVAILELQEREVTVPGACRRENCWEPRTGQEGLAPPGNGLLAFPKCPRVQPLPSIHPTMGPGLFRATDTIHG